jgi:hypothetical protein
MDGVVNEFPEPNDAPPVEAAYQLIVPAEAVAPMVTVPVPQFAPGVLEEMVGMELIVAITAVLAADKQVPLVPSAK